MDAWGTESASRGGQRGAIELPEGDSAASGAIDSERRCSVAPRSWAAELVDASVTLLTSSLSLLGAALDALADSGNDPLPGTVDVWPRSLAELVGASATVIPSNVALADTAPVNFGDDPLPDAVIRGRGSWGCLTLP